LATYRAHLPELLEREGDYVVIRDEEIAGICGDPETAVALGYDQFGAGGFMIKRIAVVDEVLALPQPVVRWRS
jgi:hypothetical protein